MALTAVREERNPSILGALAEIRHRIAALAGGVNYSTDPCTVSLCAWLPVGNELPI